VTVTIELLAGSARVLIAPEVGGSIAAFEWDGQPILRPTSERAIAEAMVRKFACFPLVPFSNRIAGATLHWAGREHALTRYVDTDPHAIHGNGWRRPWSVRRREPARLELELDHDASGARAREWPFPYRASQRFELVGDRSSITLELALDIENTGEDAFPFGLGWHPYFDRPEGTELGFVSRGVWLTDQTRLPTRFTMVPAAWHFDPPRDIGRTAVDNCFAGWQAPATVRWPARTMSARIGADSACDYLVVFVPSIDSGGGSFFAVEPVTHMTDAFNRTAGDANADTGTRVLAPGACFSCTMSICVSRGA
jgi:aldose 1-epimerase